MIGTQISNYRIEGKLGEGGMGVVYKAVDVNLDRTVAVKVLSSELGRDPELIERFQTEAKAQANLNHTNIATLYNFINVDGNWLIVMEYVDGLNLEQTIHRKGVMQYEDAVPLFKQALAGIGFAHRFGIIHRDIKPANIMINRHGIVKVMDFGIAKVLSARRLTRTGVSVGTVTYMSPEQIRNQGVDIRSDIYSLGVTLYQMLTAHVPFESESDFQVQYDHVNTPPPPLSLYYPYVPAGIEAAVLKAIQKDPAARFRTVEEFAAALDSPHAVPVASAGEATQPIVRGNEPTIGVTVQDFSPPATPAPAPAQGAAAATAAAQTTNVPPAAQAGPGPLTPKNLIIAGAAFLVLVMAVGVVIWRKSSSHQAAGAPPSAGSPSEGGASSSTAQSAPQAPASTQPEAPLALPTAPTTPEATPPKPSEGAVQSQKKQQPAKDPGAVALDKARTMLAAQRVLQPPKDCAIYWAQQATAQGNSGGPEMEQRIKNQVHTQFQAAIQAQNYSQATYLFTTLNKFYPGQFESWRGELRAAEPSQKPVAENQPKPAPTTTTTPAADHTFNVRHRHSSKLGFGSEWYSNGTLTVAASGSVAYHCTSVPSGKVCEPDIALSVINNVKVNAEGVLHLSTSQGNYDFMGDGNTTTEIKNALLVAKHK
jgi:serine/threonine-protein kinase